MTDLTDKWKAGKLEEGYYYIKVNKTLSYVEIDYYHIFGETKYWSGNDEEDICEIIAKVPSYKEYQEIKNGNDMFISKIKNAWFFNVDRNDFLQKIHILTESQMKLENTIGELGQENGRLKGLLKECMDMFVKMYSTNTVNSVFIELYENIKTKIDEALK